MLDFDPEIDFAIDAGVPESMGTFAFSEDLASPSDNLLGGMILWRRNPMLNKRQSHRHEPRQSRRCRGWKHQLLRRE